MTGQELKALRLKLGHSQGSLALALGVSTRTVLRWEEGAEVPHLVQLAMRSVPSRKSEREDFNFEGAVLTKPGESVIEQVYKHRAVKCRTGD